MLAAGALLLIFVVGLCAAGYRDTHVLPTVDSCTAGYRDTHVLSNVDSERSNTPGNLHSVNLKHF